MPALPKSIEQQLATRPVETFAPGELLFAPDAVATHVWFLRRGLVRVFTLDAAGNEFNHDFLGDGEWVVGRVAWRALDVCCAERALGAAALRPSAAVRVGIAELDDWRGRDPEIAAYLVDTLMQLTAARYGREADLAQRSAEQRYVELIGRHPELLNTVPLREIAAWLAITPVALSRIRRRLGAR